VTHPPHSGPFCSDLSLFSRDTCEHPQIICHTGFISPLPIRPLRLPFLQGDGFLLSESTILIPPGAACRFIHRHLFFPTTGTVPPTTSRFFKGFLIRFWRNYGHNGGVCLFLHRLSSPLAYPYSGGPFNVTNNIAPANPFLGRCSAPSHVSFSIIQPFPGSRRL